MTGTILETKLECDGETINVVTEREPGETIAQHSARHDAEVEQAEEDCKGGSSSALTYNTSWSSGGRERTYRSPSSSTQDIHDGEVATLKAQHYPPS